MSVGLLLTAVACGFDVQTLQPYTPSDGLNADAGGVKIRNLMLLSHADGEAILSGSLVAYDRDALNSVSGTVVKADGTDGSSLTSSMANPVGLGNGVLVVLTDRAPIVLKGADLKPGLEAKLVLTFSRAGEVKLTVPVVDANLPSYQTVSPAPSATPSS
ncbi:hypothetical protein JOE57_001225 [Microlunatus panaciterrae]|uniref:Copper(I)-binding protein n=1 Tax=Microlunatus panaciterrae TaxID=400768 RepID=A0ABS2RK25_9ACTN|nr:hypothetical protein [Microlunatus panaciterrae]MBM7798304.1 hypothetical protein [Microlunatus panaciterrae]